MHAGMHACLAACVYVHVHALAHWGRHVVVLFTTAVKIVCACC
jgi:hypothetical protein